MINYNILQILIFASRFKICYGIPIHKYESGSGSGSSGSGSSEPDNNHDEYIHSSKLFPILLGLSPIILTFGFYILFQIVVNIAKIIIYVKRVKHKYKTNNLPIKNGNFIAELIEKANTFDYNRDQINLQNSGCSICLENINISPQEHTNYVYKTSCNHIYHSECLNEWIQMCHANNNVASCPMCRINIYKFNYNPNDLYTFNPSLSTTGDYDSDDYWNGGV